MPTYQYACTACDHRFDTVQSFADASLTECPACSGILRKVFSSVGIVFKGSGFYRNDSRAGAGSTVAKGENGAKVEGAKSEPATASSSTGSEKKGTGEKKTASTSAASSPAKSAAAS